MSNKVKREYNQSNREERNGAKDYVIGKAGD